LLYTFSITFSFSRIVPISYIENISVGRSKIARKIKNVLLKDCIALYAKKNHLKIENIWGYIQISTNGFKRKIKNTGNE